MNKLTYSFSLLLLFLLMTGSAQASEIDVWNTPLERFSEALTGRSMRALGVIITVGTAITILYTEIGPGLKQLAKVVLILSIAFNAAQLVNAMWGN